MTKPGKKTVDAAAPLRPRAAAHARRGARAGEGDGHPQVRRDGRGRVPPRRRPPQGRPDDPRHRVAAQRHRQERAGGGVRPGRRGPRGRGGRRRRRRLRRPRRADRGRASSTSTSPSPRPTSWARSASSAAPSARAASCRTRRPAPSPTTSARPSASSRRGKVEYRTDRYGNVHVPIGKASFDAPALVENYHAVLDELLRAKPASAKGRYLQSVTISSTMGPGVKIDPTVTHARGARTPAAS